MPKKNAAEKMRDALSIFQTINLEETWLKLVPEVSPSILWDYFSNNTNYSNDVIDHIIKNLRESSDLDPEDEKLKDIIDNHVEDYIEYANDLYSMLKDYNESLNFNRAENFLAEIKSATDIIRGKVKNHIETYKNDQASKYSKITKITKNKIIKNKNEKIKLVNRHNIETEEAILSDQLNYLTILLHARFAMLCLGAKKTKLAKKTTDLLLREEKIEKIEKTEEKTLLNNIRWISSQIARQEASNHLQNQNSEKAHKCLEKAKNELKAYHFAEEDAVDIFNFFITKGMEPNLVTLQMLSLYIPSPENPTLCAIIIMACNNFINSIAEGAKKNNFTNYLPDCESLIAASYDYFNALLSNRSKTNLVSHNAKLDIHIIACNRIPKYFHSITFKEIRFIFPKLKKTYKPYYAKDIFEIILKLDLKENTYHNNTDEFKKFINELYPFLEIPDASKLMNYYFALNDIKQGKTKQAATYLLEKDLNFSNNNSLIKHNNTEHKEDKQEHQETEDKSQHLSEIDCKKYLEKIQKRIPLKLFEQKNFKDVLYFFFLHGEKLSTQNALLQASFKLYLIEEPQNNLTHLLQQTSNSTQKENSFGSHDSPFFNWLGQAVTDIYEDPNRRPILVAIFLFRHEVKEARELFEKPNFPDDLKECIDLIIQCYDLLESPQLTSEEKNQLTQLINELPDKIPEDLEENDIVNLLADCLQLYYYADTSVDFKNFYNKFLDKWPDYIHPIIQNIYVIYRQSQVKYTYKSTIPNITSEIDQASQTQHVTLVDSLPLVEENIKKAKEDFLLKEEEKKDDNWQTVTSKIKEKTKQNTNLPKTSSTSIIISTMLQEKSNPNPPKKINTFGKKNNNQKTKKQRQRDQKNPAEKTTPPSQPTQQKRALIQPQSTQQEIKGASGMPVISPSNTQEKIDKAIINDEVKENIQQPILKKSQQSPTNQIKTHQFQSNTIEEVKFDTPSSNSKSNSETLLETLENNVMQENIDLDEVLENFSNLLSDAENIPQFENPETSFSFLNKASFLCKHILGPHLRQKSETSQNNSDTDAYLKHRTAYLHTIRAIAWLNFYLFSLEIKNYTFFNVLVDGKTAKDYLEKFDATINTYLRIAYDNFGLLLKEEDLPDDYKDGPSEALTMLDHLKWKKGICLLFLSYSGTKFLSEKCKNMQYNAAHNVLTQLWQKHKGKNKDQHIKSATECLIKNINNKNLIGELCLNQVVHTLDIGMEQRRIHYLTQLFKSSLPLKFKCLPIHEKTPDRKDTPTHVPVNLNKASEEAKTDAPLNKNNSQKNRPKSIWREKATTPPLKSPAASSTCRSPSPK